MEPGTERYYTIYPLLWQTNLITGEQRRIGMLGYNPSIDDLVIDLAPDWCDGMSEDTREILQATIEQFQTMAQERLAPTVMHTLQEDCSHSLQLGECIACVEATHDSIKRKFKTLKTQFNHSIGLPSQHYNTTLNVNLQIAPPEANIAAKVKGVTLSKVAF